MGPHYGIWIGRASEVDRMQNGLMTKCIERRRGFRHRACYEEEAGALLSGVCSRSGVRAVVSLMKKLFRLAVVVGFVGVGCAVWAADPGNSGGGSGSRPGSTRENWQDVVKFIRAQQANPRTGLSEAQKQKLADLRTRIEEILKDREAFRAQQLVLAQTLKSVAQEERERLREQMQAAREEFLKNHQDLIVDVKQRLAELRQELRDNRDRILEAAREQNQSAGRGNRGR